MSQSETLTIIFTDLVGSTEHLQRVGDEAGAQLFRAHHRLMTEAVETTGGTELEWLGDGMLAAFSSASDAVRCAILMQQTASKPAGGARLGIRIGVHLGEVLRRDSGYSGMPLVIARRICDSASTGQILCSRIVADLLSSRQSFGFRDQGDLKLKGVATPIGVCEVIYEANDPVAMLNRTPFVGRAAQLKRLSAKLDEAFNGRGGVAMLRGEAGIGKSRTLEEFSDHAIQRGALVLRGACYDGEWQSPYRPFGEIIADYAQQAARGEVAKTIGKWAGPLSRIAPSLADVLDDISQPVTLDKEEERFRLFDAVALSLGSISRRAPIVVIVDDLHWANRGTVALLTHVAHTVSDNQILLIGAYRDGEVNRSHPLSAALAAISRLRNSETLALKGLHADELSSLLQMVGDHDAPKSLVDALNSATEGNPLFIRELLLHVVEEGKLLRDGNGWMPRISIEELGIPEGVRQVIGTRLLKLSDTANHLLSVASAFRGAFSFEIATGVADQNEQTALAAIDEALDAQLIRPGQATDTFDFTHALIRHTLYSELNPARRSRLHRRIAEEMERAWGERAASHAAEVAFHFWRGAAAGNQQRGADYALAAAENAEAAYAHDDVAEFLRIALELLPENDARRTQLLVRMASALSWTGQAEEAKAAALEASALIGKSEGSDPAADYCENAAREMLHAGDMDGAWALAREGLRLIGERRDITWASLDEIDAYRPEDENAPHPGIVVDSERLRRRREVLKKIPSEQAKARRIDEYPYDSREQILRDPNSDGIPRLCLAGDCRGSLPIWQERAAEAERSGRIHLAMDSWSFAARCQIALGNLAAARASYDRALGMAARITTPSLPLLNVLSVKSDFLFAIDHGVEELSVLPGEQELFNNPPPQFRWAFAAGCAVTAETMAHFNNVDQAMQLMPIIHNALLCGAPGLFVYVVLACDTASTLWLLNRTDRIDLVERSIREKVLEPDFRFPMRDARLSLARLCALQGRHTEASQWFAKARDILDEDGWRPLRTLVDYDEALMYVRAAKNPEKAQRLLETAIPRFNSLGMTGWLKRAHTLLGQLGNKTGTVSTVPALEDVQ